MDEEDLRRRIAFVFQEYGRYAATVAENIAYGDWPRLADERAEAEDAADRAGLTRAVEKMPERFDTVLGRQFGHYEPSGGVWQRIAIARAFARRAPILTVQDSSPHALAWVGSVFGQRTRALGVTTFGQSGYRNDLYRYFHLDTESIIAAGFGLCDGA